MRANGDFYVRRLYPMQDRILAAVASIETGFYLTGGTAASRGYLHHRFSDDLDFFVNDDDHFGLWAQRIVQALARQPGWQVATIQREARFVRLNVTEDDVVMKIEMVNDVPAHVGELYRHPILGLLDSPENILANKLTAVVDRDEPKDLADIWGFCCRLGLSCEAALGNAQSKATTIVVPVQLTPPEPRRLPRWLESGVLRLQSPARSGGSPSR